MKCVAILWALIFVSACSPRYVPVNTCQPVPPRTLITVQDYVLRAVELETYLKECSKGG